MKIKRSFSKLKRRKRKLKPCFNKLNLDFSQSVLIFEKKKSNKTAQKNTIRKNRSIFALG